jgi:hypothetical protein
MATHARSRRSLPWIEGLEERRLLTYAATSSSYYSALAATARHEYDQFVSEVQSIELQSQATPAEYLGLRDDARAISEAATSTSLPPQAAAAKALAVTLELDRAPFYGSLSDQAWAEEATKLEGDLTGLNVTQSLIDRTLADMEAVATSAGVTADQYTAFVANLAQVRSIRSQVPSGYGHIPDPGLFYTQHLRGFFRGWAVQRKSDQARLKADLHAIPASVGASQAEAATVTRDARILQTLGALVTSQENEEIHDAFLAAFANGAPSGADLSALRSQLVSAIGPTASPSRLAAIDRLIVDAPVFDRGVGGSPANVRTIADDVQAVVNDGAGAAPDPFKVTIASG